MEQRHEAEFEAFVASRWQRLARVAYLLTGDWGHAEDLVQTALATCYRHWPKLVATGGEEAYVRMAMVNAHISAGRRRRFRELITFRLPERAGADDTRSVDDRDLLRRALRRLPPRTRAAVVLRHYAGLSEADAAIAMSCSVGNIKRLSSQGLQRLREYLVGAGMPSAGYVAAPLSPQPVPGDRGRT